MARVAECFLIRKKKLKTKKRYTWFIPKALDSKISKGDIVLGRTPNRGIRDACPAMMVDIFENDHQEHYPIIRILEKYKEEKVKNEKEKDNEVRSSKESEKVKTEVNKNVIEKPKSKRGTRFSDEEKEMIKKHRAAGKTLKEIAEMYSCAISTIHKIVKS